VFSAVFHSKVTLPTIANVAMLLVKKEPVDSRK
jgi:hypothetical protein